jgi:hypothetical protein
MKTLTLNRAVFSQATLTIWHLLPTLEPGEKSKNKFPKIFSQFVMSHFLLKVLTKQFHRMTFQPVLCLVDGFLVAPSSWWEEFLSP